MDSGAVPRRFQRFASTSLFLVALVLLTRLPLFGPWQGEPDSACFLVAVAQWLRFWPHLRQANFTYGYFPVLAPGYFALWQWSGHWLHFRPAHLAEWLNGASLLAQLLAAPLLYRIGRQFLPPRVAAVAAVLYLLSPGFWWLGLEAHPEGLMILAVLAGLDQCLSAAAAPPGRRQQLHGAAAGVAFSLALLLRVDALFLFPVCLAVLVLAPATRRRSHSLVTTTAIFVASCLVFVLARAAILGQSLLHAQHATVAVVTRFALQLSLSHQLAPFVTTPGPGVALFAAAGWWFLLRSARHRSGQGSLEAPPAERAPVAGKRSHDPERVRASQRSTGATRVRSGVSTLWLLAAVVPGAVFWFLIRGNVVHHITPLWLAPLWAGAWGWWRRAPRALLPAASLALVLNWVAVPPNSNVNLYPSPDVFLSHHLLVLRQQAMAAQAPRLQALALPASAPLRACFIGTAVNPFLLAASILSPQPPRVVSANDAWQQLIWTGAPGQPPRAAWLGEAYTDSGYHSARQRCGPAISLEYAPNGGYRWFLGGELARSRLFAWAQHWSHHQAAASAAAIATRQTP